MKKLLSLLLVVNLVACVSNDPRQGGFFGGVAGLNNGNYDKRVAERQQTLANVQSMHQSLQTDNARLQQQRNVKLSELRRAKRQLASLNKDMRQLKNRIASLRRSKKISAQQARKMQRDLANRQRAAARQQSQLANAKRTGDAQALAKAQAKIRALKRQQDEAMRQALIMTQ